MSKEKPKAADNLKEVEHALTTAELFFEKNAKLITIIFGKFDVSRDKSFSTAGNNTSNKP